MGTLPDIGRRSFLKGRSASQRPPLRPPGALDEARFAAACTRCSACRQACPTGVIRVGEGRYPQLVFADAECTFCGACVAACESGALIAPVPRALAARVRVGEGCVAQRLVLCRACGDACDVRAIVLDVRTRGIAAPRVLSDRCTGCGACVSVCPASAIDVVVQQSKTTWEVTA